jgi:predicted nucleic acid-binding protein
VAEKRPSFVVDASVAGKWFLDDEDFVAEATQVLLDYRAQRITLSAPYHLRYEVPSLISKAVGGRRITADQARELTQSFLGLNLKLVRSRKLWLDAIDRVQRFRCSFYDGLYIALAETTGSRFIHADARLRRSLNGQCQAELWIEDYETPPAETGNSATTSI